MPRRRACGAPEGRPPTRPNWRVHLKAVPCPLFPLNSLFLQGFNCKNSIILGQACPSKRGGSFFLLFIFFILSILTLGDTRSVIQELLFYAPVYKTFALADFLSARLGLFNSQQLFSFRTSNHFLE